MDVICEPNATQITVRRHHLSNILHHPSKENLLKSEKELSRLLWSLASCTSEKKGVCGKIQNEINLPGFEELV